MGVDTRSGSGKQARTGVCCELAGEFVGDVTLASTEIRFSTFPRTKPPPEFIRGIVDVFRLHESSISTIILPKGLRSDPVLAILSDDLAKLGFRVETGKKAGSKLDRPVFFGENGEPSLRYEIDAFHAEWMCGLEIEAGRATQGNAIFRDLFQAMVMVDIDHLCLAVPNAYKYKNKIKCKDIISKDYEKTTAVADALFGHGRSLIPYGLTVIGY